MDVKPPTSTPKTDTTTGLIIEDEDSFDFGDGGNNPDNGTSLVDVPKPVAPNAMSNSSSLLDDQPTPTGENTESVTTEEPALETTTDSST